MKERERGKEESGYNDPVFHHFPYSQRTSIDIDSRVTIPSEDDTEEGREWVNFNQK